MITCRYCGADHGALCPMVKAYEYHVTGELKRVEFWTRAELDSAMVGPGVGTGSVVYKFSPDHCPFVMYERPKPPKWFRSG